jgi:hypothetical protein
MLAMRVGREESDMDFSVAGEDPMAVFGVFY